MCGEVVVQRDIFGESVFFSAPSRFALETPKNLRIHWENVARFGRPFLRTTPSPLIRAISENVSLKTTVLNAQKCGDLTLSWIPLLWIPLFWVVLEKEAAVGVLFSCCSVVASAVSSGPSSGPHWHPFWLFSRLFASSGLWPLCSCHQRLQKRGTPPPPPVLAIRHFQGADGEGVYVLKPSVAGVL